MAKRRNFKTIFLEGGTLTIYTDIVQIKSENG